MQYISFHGYNVADEGKNTVDRLKPFLDVTDVDYGWTGLVKVKLCNSCIAAAVSNLIPKNAAAIGHSNGCLIATLAADSFSKLILINPALDVDQDFPSGLEVNIYYTPTDKAVFWAKFIPWSKWGAMGRKGSKFCESDAKAYISPNGAKITQFNSYELFGSEKHSDVFLSAEQLAQHIKDNDSN